MLNLLLVLKQVKHKSDFGMNSEKERNKNTTSIWSLKVVPKASFTPHHESGTCYAKREILLPNQKGVLPHQKPFHGPAE
jgi:hypothetical protein